MNYVDSSTSDSSRLSDSPSGKTMEPPTDWIAASFFRQAGPTTATQRTLRRHRETLKLGQYSNDFNLSVF